MNNFYSSPGLHYERGLMLLLQQAIQDYPVVVLTGARHVGKSPLLFNATPFNDWSDHHSNPPIRYNQLMKHKGQSALKINADTSIVRAALTELQTALRETYGDQAPILLLYGSYSRKEATCNSDVDVVLLYPGMVKPGKEINQLREVLSVLNLRYQILISLLPVSLHQYQNSPTAFWTNVRREAVPIDSL